MVQRIRHRVVAGVVQHLLHPGHGERGAGGDLLRDVHDMRHHGCLIIEDLVQQAVAHRLRRGHAPPREGQFPRHTLRDQMRQALQRADIGGHADIDLLDGDEGIGAGVAAVAGGDQVHAAADAGPVDGGQHRDLAAFDHIECLLHLQHRAAQPVPLPRRFRLAVRLEQGGEILQVEAGGEMPTAP